MIPAILAMLGIMFLTLYLHGVSLYFVLMRFPGVVGIYLHPEKQGFGREPFEVDAMLLAQDNNIFTVNGYSAREPKGYHPVRTCADLSSCCTKPADRMTGFECRM